ncbi:hypothetical protein D1007_34878 [Hordeum vulgare]|nr:hypothetical protein D1007_34878 [Hordeum vulgare]
MSLGTEDLIVPEDPFKQECFWRRLIATAGSMKHKQQQQQANTNELNEKCLGALSAEQDLKDRRHSVPKSTTHGHGQLFSFFTAYSCKASCKH